MRARPPDSRCDEVSAARLRLRRAARWAAQFLLGTTWIAATAIASSPRTAAVTARPPLEAIPASSVTRAQQARQRRCDAAATAKRLKDRERRRFVRACMAPKVKAAETAAHTARTSR